MVRPERIIRRARTTRAQILTAALELFAQGGYAGTSVRAIADRAGLTDPAIYYYFATKRHMFDALLAEVNFDELRPLSGTLESGIDTLVQVFNSLVDSANVARMAFREQVSGDPVAILLRQKFEAAFRANAEPLLREHYGDAADQAGSILFYTVCGLYWGGLLRFGANFEEAVKEDHFQRRLRGVLLACMPVPAEGA